MVPAFPAHPSIMQIKGIEKKTSEIATIIMSSQSRLPNLLSMGNAHPPLSK
jgi:hypothetical protein